MNSLDISTFDSRGYISITKKTVFFSIKLPNRFLDTGGGNL